MEILDLRHFSSLDLRPLLDDETQLWSRLLSWDYTSSAEMILRYVDAKSCPDTRPSTAGAFLVIRFSCMRAARESSATSMS